MSKNTLKNLHKQTENLRWDTKNKQGTVTKRSQTGRMKKQKRNTNTTQNHDIQIKHNHKQTRNGYSKKWRVNRTTRTKWKSDHKQENNMTTGTQNKHKVMRNDPK